MATYTYEAMSEAGKPQKGTIEAGSREEAIAKIKSQRLFPTDVKEQKAAKQGKGDGKVDAAGQAKAKGRKKSASLGFGRVSTKVMTTFTRQLSTLQDAGLPLLRSLQILESQQKPGKLKNILLGVCEEVEGGSSLSEAMSKYPKAFDRLYVKMVNAGEIGGVLDVILQRLAEFMEKSQKLKRKIRGAMVYPIVVIAISGLILTGIMVFIIPKFEEIFRDFGVALPALTQGLIWASRWVAGTNTGQAIPGWIIALPSPIFAWIIFKLIRQSGPGRAATDTITLWLPIFGNLVKKTVIARFTRTLGTLVSAGVPILEAIKITSETCNNYVYEKALVKCHDSIREGESFAEPLRLSKTCDPIVVNMIEVGEETGEIDQMLIKIADNYDDEVDVAVASLVSLLEPLMVVVLGGIVGTIVVAMFLPLVAMIQSLQGGK